MSLSLREQLLAAGLGTKKQAKQAEQQQRREARNKEVQEEQRRRATQAQAEKAARDQELNRKRQEEAQRRARMAEIKQIIEQHRLPKLETDEYFNFIDRHKVRRIGVNAERREQLTAGKLVIVRCEGKYDVVSPDIAERIREREPRAVVSLAQNSQEPNPDDPYKDYIVPDDLMW